MIGWRAGMCRLAILAAPLLAFTASLPAEQTSEVSPQLFERAALAERRPPPREPDPRGGRPREPSVHLLYGGGQRRRLEDD